MLIFEQACALLEPSLQWVEQSDSSFNIKTLILTSVGYNAAWLGLYGDWIHVNQAYAVLFRITWELHWFVLSLPELFPRHVSMLLSKQDVRSLKVDSRMNARIQIREKGLESHSASGNYSMTRSPIGASPNTQGFSHESKVIIFTRYWFSDSISFCYLGYPTRKHRPVPRLSDYHLSRTRSLWLTSETLGHLQSPIQSAVRRRIFYRTKRRS